MSTRGIYGFRKNGIDKTTYNHSDSYPSGLGTDIAKFFANVNLDDLKKVFDDIILVDQNGVVPPQVAASIPAECSDFSVNAGRNTFYCYLRNTQGDLSWYLKGLKHMPNSSWFIKNSLHCEWGYIVNLDTDELEVWKGHQKTPMDGNRYGTTPAEEGLYPCALVAKFTQEEIRSGDFDKFVEEHD